MILVDTAVWIDHLHAPDAGLVDLLEHDSVVTHPMVLGELILGSIRERREFIALLTAQRTLPVVSDEEYLVFVESQRLMSRGLSYVDVHLLASTIITPGVRLWTRDRRLRRAAAELDVGWHPGPGGAS